MSLRLAITIGDAAGIGPEVIVKSLSRWPLSARRRVSVVVISDPAPLNSIAKKLRLKTRFKKIASWEDFPSAGARIPCYFDKKFPVSFKRGVSQKKLSELAVHSIRTAVFLAMQKKVDAIVTASINKAALKRAGFDVPGHTELLAQLSGVRRTEMMLVGGKLRVVLVTRHLALKTSRKILRKPEWRK